MHILHHVPVFVNTTVRLYNLPHYTKTSWMQSYITGQSSISYIYLSVQNFGKLCWTSKALQHFPVTHLSHQYALCSHLSDNKLALVMHFASPMFPVLPGGVNPISLPGYRSSSDLWTIHTISIIYFVQSFGLHSVPYFFILQSINFTPITFLYRTHIF